MMLIAKNWVWVGVGALATILGLVFVFGTESWRWLGAFAVVLGLVLVMRGPAGAQRSTGASSGDREAAQPCCVPRELARETRNRRVWRRRS